jgi:hypothetical protein
VSLRGFRTVKQARALLNTAAASLHAGVPIEDISDTLGHRSITATAEIYRHPIAPIRSGHMVAINQLITTAPERKNPKGAPLSQTSETTTSQSPTESPEPGA